MFFDLWLVFDLNFEIYVQEEDTECDQETIDIEERKDAFVNETINKGSFSSSSEKSPKLADNYEPIEIDGQKETGVWVHHPGSEVSQTWEPRKGKSRRADTEIQREPNDICANCNSTVSGSLNTDSSSPDDNPEDKHRMKTVRKGLHKIGSVFRRSRKRDDKSGPLVEDFPSPRDNIRSVNSKAIGVKFVMEDNIAGFPTGKIHIEGGSTEGSGSESPAKGNVKDMAKHIFKHAEKSARSLKQVLSRKSRKYKGDSATLAENENENDSDSSDDESFSVLSPIDKRTEIVSQAMAPCDNGSPEASGNVVVTVSSNTTVDNEEASMENKDPEKVCSPDRSNVEVVEQKHVKEEVVADKRDIGNFAE